MRIKFMEMAIETEFVQFNPAAKLPASNYFLEDFNGEGD